MNVRALEAALAAAGIPGVVDADGTVAVLRLPSEDRSIEDPDCRRTAVALATEHGFRTLALEVDD